MLKLPIYLDNNATTKLDERVFEAMKPYFLEHYGNAASRSHFFGWEAEEAVQYAREQVAQLIGAEPKEIVFTSGATEADNLAIKGVFEMYAAKGNHIITVATEHKAVLDTCAHIERLGGEITYLGVDKEGLLNIEELKNAIKPATILIAVMYANNEIGVIQSIREIGAIGRKNGILFFTDATQAAGKIPIDVNEDNIDLMSFSAHKMHGPKGVGALYVRRKSPRVRLTAQIDGGGHEKNMRSGTLNVPGIVGFGKACELRRIEMEKDTILVKNLRDKLESELLKIEDCRLNSSAKNRLPNTCNVSFKYIDSESLLPGFNKDIAVSSGSACTSATLQPSYVLKAIGLDDDLAKASLRFGLSKFTTEEEIDFTVGRVTETVLRMREANLRWQMEENGRI